MSTRADSRPEASFRHEALLYSGPAEFADHVGSFIREGVDRGEPVLVIVPEERIATLRDGLPEDAKDHVSFRDMRVVGRNPARLIPAWQAFLDVHRGRALRGVGEPVWAGRTPDELAECRWHEALLNLAFADAGAFTLLCPYDRHTLVPGSVEEAHTMHAFLVEDGMRRRSGSFSADVSRHAFQDPLPPPTMEPEVVSFGPGDLGRIRNIVEAKAAAFGIDAERATDLALAVHELAANSIRHGGGSGVLHTWTDPGAFFAEVQDSGHLQDPLAGRRRPTFGHRGGSGLWVANQLCDLVQIRSGPAGTKIRLKMCR